MQALFDEGALVRNGAVKVARPLSQLRLPPTVQGILASRIDRLAAEQKDLLQTLAVIGRESPLGLIRKVAAKAEAQLERMLADLQAVEFIYEQPTLTEPEYVFKHALTQEVAYQSILSRTAQEDSRAGRRCDRGALSGTARRASGETSASLPAQSRYREGRHYLKRAADQAAQRSSTVEAEAQYRDAISIVKELPPTRERDRLSWESSWGWQRC